LGWGVRGCHVDAVVVRGRGQLSPTTRVGEFYSEVEYVEVVAGTESQLRDSHYGTRFLYSGVTMLIEVGQKLLVKAGPCS
jgi:hypothetical protein